MTELRPYQREAIRAMKRADGRAIFAYAPGTGKTGTTAAYLDKNTTGRILVVAPNGPVLTHWQNELGRFGSIDAMLGTGTPTQRANLRKCSDLILNYECMRGDIDELLKIDWDAIVFDESHRLKNRKSQTYKAAMKLARRTDRVMLVTGTPILNRAEELWASLSILEPAKYRSFWRWAEMHFHIVQRRYAGRLVREVCNSERCAKCRGRGLLPGHARMLRQELGDKLIQKPLSLLLPDLPPVSVTYMTVTLSSDERALYDSMRENAWMQVGETVHTAPFDITKQLRLRQLASDWSAFNETGELGAKASAAVELVKDLDGEQCVIFVTFRDTVTALCRSLPGAVAYHGGMSRSERDDAIAKFVTGKAQVLVGTIGTMSEGIDGLQVARNVIFLDRDWTPARNEQAVARLQRSGQQSAVNVVHLVAADTMDDVVASALRRKQSVIDAVLHSSPQTLEG